MGFFADIENMPEQVAYGKTFFKRWYGPQNTSLVIVGDIDPHKTIALVEKYWGEWKKGDFTADIKPEPAQTASKYFHMENKDQPNNYIVTGYHGPKFDPSSKDYSAVTLLAELYFGD
ncbi:MAG: insulinase family protein, partial [Gammaproteobacteria bacterium]|nr:insulinase family protein [Gammaproteobacteria bacterium]